MNYVAESCSAWPRQVQHDAERSARYNAAVFSTFLIVLPVFALIFAGWFARRIDVLREHAAAELNRFVVYLALPAMLAETILHASWAEIWQPGFVAAFGGSAVLLFALTMVIQLRRGAHLADAAIDGLNAGYANTGFIGFPLALVALGPAALAPAVVATIITACLLFAVAIALIELGLQAEASRGAILAKAGGRLIRNPILVAPLLAGIFAATGLTMPAPADGFLKLLAAAASPCALVALGAFLARSGKGAGAVREPAMLVGAKLFGQPLLAWGLATHVFRLPAPLTHTAVLLAALPTGTGPFMLAELYGRRAEVTSRVILASTIAAVITVSAYLALV